MKYQRGEIVVQFKNGTVTTQTDHTASALYTRLAAVLTQLGPAAFFAEINEVRKSDDTHVIVVHVDTDMPSDLLPRRS